TGVSSSIHGKTKLQQFLVACVYPGGSGPGQKRHPIHSKYIPVTGFLDAPLRKLQDTDVFPLCEELAALNHSSIEFDLGKKLFSFLNSTIPKVAIQKVSAKQLRNHNIA